MNVARRDRARQADAGQRDCRSDRGADRGAGRALIRRGLIAGLAMVLAGSVSAQSPVACHPDQLHQIADAPVDLGDGIVYQYIYPGAGGIADGLVLFTACESGVKIAAALPLLPDETRRTADEVADIMRAAMAAEEVFTAGDVIAAMTAAGAPAQLRQSPREACACALYYPEMQGEKEPWVAP